MGQKEGGRLESQHFGHDSKRTVSQSQRDGGQGRAGREKHLHLSHSPRPSSMASLPSHDLMWAITNWSEWKSPPACTTTL